MRTYIHVVPVGCYITFQHKVGYTKGLKFFGKYVKEKDRYVLPEECTLATHLKFKKAPNPSSINWENRAASNKKEWTRRTIKIVVKLLVYETICAVTIFLMGTFIKRLVFDYYFSSQCEDINEMMKNSPNYLSWANKDKLYRADSSMTGIYQCYCQT